MGIANSIKEYHQNLREGTTSCEKTVAHYLEAIEKDRSLNAFLHVYGDEALEKARQLDRQRSEGKPLGKLHGVVIGIKDVIAYKDHPLSAASRILEDYVSIYNATAVEKLLA